MKVIKVINSLDFGGIEKVFEIVARYHQGDKTDLIFLALGKGGATEEAISKLDFRVIVWNVRTRIPNIGLILRLARFFRKEKPSVVHTTGAEGNFHGILAAYLAGVPVRIAEEIGMPTHGKAARFIFRQVYRSAYRVIAVAGLVEKFLLDTKEVPAWKTSLIYNPVDVRAFEAIKADPDPCCFRIVSVCRLDPIKNLQLLIRGFGALDIPAELWLVGDGPARSELEALVRERGLEGRVVFHGYQSRPSEFLQKASLFVLPSFSEGLGMSAVEAMLTGTPCLATRIGGMPEFIRDGENGWLLDPKDLPQFTALLRRIAEMPAAERRKIGQKGKQTALEKFQPETYLSEIEKLYRKKERIRVLHCLETIGSGGVEQLRYHLSRYLDKSRFSQKIVCTQAIGVLPDRMRAQGMEVIPVGLLRSPFQWVRYRAVLKVIRSYRPHIVHGAVFEGLTLGTVAGRLARVPIVIIEEAVDPVGRSWRAHFLMRRFAHWSDYVIAVSPAVGRYVREVLHVKEPKLRLIPNAADVPVIPEVSLRASLGFSPEDFVVGSVGRLLDSHKKFSDLIRAAALLKDRVPGFRLLIVGDGPDRGALEELAASLGVAVVFTGYQGDTAPYFACMDLFALASQMEGLPIVLIEAMFFRLPVVATAVGGIPDAVLQDRTGLLVEKNAPEQLANAIEQLCLDPSRRKSLGDAGFERAMENFTIGVYVDRIAALYLEAAGKKGVHL